MLKPDDCKDQLNFLAGDLGPSMALLFGHQPQAFCVAPRHRRHLWLALTDIAPSAAQSGLVRFGFDAPADTLINWAIDRPSPWLAPVLRRCMPQESLPRGWYRRLHNEILDRPRTGRVLCQAGELSVLGIEAIFSLPASLVERSVITLVNGNVRRAEAVRELWQVALDRGRDASNLRRAICMAKDTEALEMLLMRAVQADRLPVSPHPEVPELRKVGTAKELVSFGIELKNCMSQVRGPFGLRRPATSYFIWADPAEGSVMLSVCADHR